MRREKGVFRRIILYVVMFVLASGYPFVAMADTQESASSPPPETTAPTQTESNGSSTQSTDTSKTKSETPPKAPEKPKYTYDPATGHWNSDKYWYNPTTGAYQTTPPKPVVIEPPEDTSKVDVDKTVGTDVDVTNEVTSNATSGNAGVIKNTTGGNATSGDAAAVATLINSVNSSITTGTNQKVAEFTQDILGDVKGDIVLSPLLLKAMLEAQAPDNLKATSVNTTNNLAVGNNLTVGATSGNATVAGNTTAGNATSGSATAVANVVNILNSMIAAQQSFVGTINIYGNLEGDILIAPDFIPQMIANNGGDAADVTVSSQDTQTIVNNISAVAESGAASVFGNTNAGSATSGDAQSNVVIFNLSGHEVVAKNSLLVFVNVLGKWVGVIVDAPVGATAAMLSNDVTTNNYDPDITVNSQSSSGITNTIAVSAQSGDAVVANNTTGGNAVSGSAKAMANIANVSGSQFSASDWIGVLFINVFQNWYGSFGINTPYGDPVKTNAPAPSAPIEFRPAPENSLQTEVHLHVIDSRAYSTLQTQLASTTSTVGDDQADTTSQAVLAADTSNDAQTPTAPQDFRLVIIAGSILLIGLSAIGLKRLLS